MRAKEIEKGDMKCPECGGMCKPTEIKVSSSKLKGWRCSKCMYEIISPKEVEKAYLLLQAKKPERVRISKRGNSYMVTIPKSIADAIGVSRKSFAEILLEDEKTIKVKL